MKLLSRHLLFGGCIIPLLLFITPTFCLGQTMPVIGLHENTPNVVAFKNALIVTAPAKVMQNATLVIRDDRIEAVGQDITIPADAVTRDMRGKTIYPGFIDLFTDYGIPKSKAKSDEGTLNDNGMKEDAAGAKHWNMAVQPERRASICFRPDKKSAESLRKNGFTTVLTFPTEGIFRGSGALVLLREKQPNQAILAIDVAQAMSFNKGRSFGGRGVAGYPSSLMGSIALIRQTFLDVQWYSQAWTNFNKVSLDQTAPETNLALDALQPYADGRKPVIMEVSDELDILRAAKIGEEFRLKMWVLGCGSEYRRLSAVKKTGLKLIVPLNFPKAPDVSTPEKELNVTLRELRHWDVAPENPGRLAQMNIDFTLTTATLKKKDDFLVKVRTAVKRGLPADKALAALTTRPAAWLNLSHLLGTLEKGKLANFIITDGDLFADKTKILDTWVAGERYEITDLPEVEVRGTWTLKINTEIETNTQIDTGSVIISGMAEKLKADLRLKSKKVKVQKVVVEDRILTMSFPGDSLDFKGMARMTGLIEDKQIFGHGAWGNGTRFQWQAHLTKPWQEKPDTTRPEPVQMAEFPVVYPEGAFGRTAPPAQPVALVVKNATIWTCGPKRTLDNADLLVERGKITNIGQNLKLPEDAMAIDATGKHITPGIIDAHSHLAISGGTNEGTHAISSETRIKDVINSDDINIYRQLAGGVTAACILHGSANPIGGQYAVIKLRWGSLPDELILHDAQPGIKFALGENVKQANWSSSNRYPQTRMGVEQIIRDAFQAAKDYHREWQIYNDRAKRNKNLISPRRNLRLEALLEVLNGKRIIHCHAYRQDEILALMRLGEELNFNVDVFIHVLEGYKVAEEMKKHGAMGTAFSDWWAYKVEAYDAIPYNGAIMHNQGVVVSYNSDSVELARRLNTEAAKAVKYGNVPPEEALKFVTLNAAKQLYLEDRLGSLEPDKDADFVIWSDLPFSTYSICEQTWLDGRKYFDLNQDKELRRKTEKERIVLIQKILNENKTKKGDQPKGEKSR